MIPGLRARVRLPARPSGARRAAGSRIRSARAAVLSGVVFGLLAWWA